LTDLPVRLGTGARCSRKVSKNMNRPIEVKVRIPRTDVVGAGVLGSAILAAAKAEKKLPEPVVKELKRFMRVHAELDRVAFDPGTAVPSEDRKAILRDETAGWRAFSGFVGSWALLRSEDVVDKIEDASAVQTALFADGMKWILLPYSKRWAQAERLLRRIEEHGLEEAIRRLGGGPFLDVVKKAHERSGEVLGITKPAIVQAETPSMRALLKSFAEALRRYVRQVDAYGAQDQPGARQTADRLLAPLAKPDPVRVKAQTPVESPAVATTPAAPPPTPPAPVTS
jgi:hypothetical protein